MIENLFNYYNNNLTFYQMVIKQNGIIRNLIIYSLFVMTFVFYILCYVFTKNLFLSFFVLSTLGVLDIFLANYINASTIKRLYSDNTKSKFGWDSGKINTMVTEEMISYINECDIDEKNLEFISTIAKEKRDSTKASFVIFISVFGVLFVPLWSAYIYLTLESFRENAQILNVITFFFFLLITVFSLLIPMLENIYDNLFSKYYKWNRFCILIDEIILKKTCMSPNK